MATAQDIISVAIQQLGIEGSPNKFTRWFGSIDGTYSYPWCATFISWCADQCGIPGEIIPREASVYNILENAKKWGRFKAKGSYTPQPGDIMIQKQGDGYPSHVGIVIAATSQSFQTIEGNHNDRVAYATRKYDSNLTGFFCPAYDGTGSKLESGVYDWSDVVTASRLDDVFGGVLKGQGNTFIKYSSAYCINPALMAAIAMHESANGTSKAATDGRNNVFGYMNPKNTGQIMSFGSLEQGIKTAISNLSRNYINKGLRTVAAIREKYAPANASNDARNLNQYWVAGVSNNYKKITGKDISEAEFGSGVRTNEEAEANLTAVNSSADGSKENKITKSTIVSEVGGRGEARPNPMEGKNTLGGGAELYIINHDGTIFFPVVSGEIALEYNRKGSPGKLSFTLIKTEDLNFDEGSQVVFKSFGINLFYGFIFTKSRDRGASIKCTAYDQLRYFKNKECYVYSNKTASELVQMIADDFNLICGELADTGYKIPIRVEDNVTLFDIVQNAFDETIINTGELYVLYDDYGKLTIRRPVDWIFDIVIDGETAQNFDYKTSIDSDNVASRIKLYYDDEDAGERKIYIHNNEEKVGEWGVLQHCEKIEEGEDGAEKAELMSQLYSAKAKTLKIKDAFGNPNVRAGCGLYISLNLGDMIQNNFMMVEYVKHKFSSDKYTMDLTLVGGGFQSE
jgi:hypothetical protein|nr:MAG TPA: 43 kDa tail protein [Caudoviricetes sp.]